MKEQSEKLFRAIGDVGDDLIARADAKIKKATRSSSMLKSLCIRSSSVNS